MLVEACAQVAGVSVCGCVLRGGHPAADILDCVPGAVLFSTGFNHECVACGKQALWAHLGKYNTVHKVSMVKYQETLEHGLFHGLEAACMRSGHHLQEHTV